MCGHVWIKSNFDGKGKTSNDFLNDCHDCCFETHKNPTLCPPRYVATRVGCIINYSKASQRHYITTNDNASADIDLRGLTVAQLDKAATWFSGPAFLTQHKNAWPLQTLINCLDIDGKKSRLLIVTLARKRYGYINQYIFIF